jgi:hypothetical protein
MRVCHSSISALLRNVLQACSQVSHPPLQLLVGACVSNGATGSYIDV